MDSILEDKELMKMHVELLDFHSSHVVMCVSIILELHGLNLSRQRNPNAQNLRIGLRERPKDKERCAREAVWRLAKSILKLKENNKAAFFSPSEKRCLPAVECTFIQKRFHPLTLSSKNVLTNDTFIQKLFHPLTLSSNDIFTQ